MPGGTHTRSPDFPRVGRSELREAKFRFDQPPGLLPCRNRSLECGDGNQGRLVEHQTR